MTVSPGTDQVPAHGEVDQPNYVEDFSEVSLNRIIKRLELSRTVEQLIYREAELDEVWRLVDGALRDVRCRNTAAEIAGVLEQFLQAVGKAHDYVGDDDDPAAAASELRQSVFLARRYTNLQSR